MKREKERKVNLTTSPKKECAEHVLHTLLHTWILAFKSKIQSGLSLSSSKRGIPKCPRRWSRSPGSGCRRR